MVPLFVTVKRIVELQPGNATIRFVAFVHKTDLDTRLPFFTIRFVSQNENRIISKYMDLGGGGGGWIYASTAKTNIQTTVRGPHSYETGLGPSCRHIVLLDTVYLEVCAALLHVEKSKTTCKLLLERIHCFH